MDECILDAGRVCDCCRANARTIEQLKRERDARHPAPREAVEQLIEAAESHHCGPFSSCNEEGILTCYLCAALDAARGKGEE